MLVKTLLSYHALTPVDDVLEDSLIELAEDVGGQDAVDVGVWKTLPERLVDTISHILFHAFLGELWC